MGAAAPHWAAAPSPGQCSARQQKSGQSPFKTEKRSENLHHRRQSVVAQDRLAARLGPPPYSVRLMSDLFASGAAATPDSYDASSIEVLEGLEPVRRRPGMYIGGTDARALHHLAAEVIDNSMDEAVAGHASRIEVTLEPGNRLTVTDNGRGIPVDPHPKYPGKSALEVILTTLHSGGKFEGKAYSTSRRPPRRRGQRRQRAVDRDDRRGRARQEALPPDLRARPRHLPARGSRRRPQPPRHHRQLRPRPRDLRRRRGVRPRAALQARALEGLSVRRGRDPLALRPEPRQRRRPRNRRSSNSPAASPTICRATRRPRVRHRPRLRRAPGFPRRAGRRRMGGRLAAVERGQRRKLLLQHHPDPRRRHP